MIIPIVSGFALYAFVGYLIWMVCDMEPSFWRCLVFWAPALIWPDKDLLAGEYVPTVEALQEQELLNRCEGVTGVKEWPKDPLFEKMTKEYLEYKEQKAKEWENQFVIPNGSASGTVAVGMPQYSTMANPHRSWCTPGEVVYWAQKNRGVRLG
jgi:hypothetical protein